MRDLPGREAHHRRRGRGHGRAAAAGGRLRGDAERRLAGLRLGLSSREVLLYPQDFDRDYGFDGDELAGQAHRWGTVILSVPSLGRASTTPTTRYHVGYPRVRAPARPRAVALRRHPGGHPRRHRARVGSRRSMEQGDGPAAARGSPAIDDPTAPTSRVEFLAVAVEAFFEIGPRAARAAPRGLRAAARLLRPGSGRLGRRPRRAGVTAELSGRRCYFSLLVPERVTESNGTAEVATGSGDRRAPGTRQLSECGRVRDPGAAETSTSAYAANRPRPMA